MMGKLSLMSTIEGVVVKFMKTKKMLIGPVEMMRKRMKTVDSIAAKV